MTVAPDSVVVTGPAFEQIDANDLLVTPTGQSQQTLASALAGGGGTSGPVAATTLSASSTVTLDPVSKNVSISPTGTGTVTISPAGALTVNPTAASTINNASIGVTTPLAGKFTTLTATDAVTLSPANKAVAISPSGTGTVAISPVGALTVNPTAASTINNTSIGVTTPAAGKFTTVAYTTDNGLTLTNQTSNAAAQTATLTNGPTAGNPAFWLRISVNGTNLAIPAWTAT